MLFDILYQSPKLLARMVTGTFVMHIPKIPLDWVGVGAVGGQVEQSEAGMGRQPLLHLPGVVNLGVVDDDRKTGKRRCRVGSVERGQQVHKQPGSFAVPHTMLGSARSEVQRARQVALL